MRAGGGCVAQFCLPYVQDAPASETHIGPEPLRRIVFRSSIRNKIHKI